MFDDEMLIFFMTSVSDIGLCTILMILVQTIFFWDDHNHQKLVQYFGSKKCQKTGFFPNFFQKKSGPLLKISSAD